jgi:hypothetical protein
LTILDEILFLGGYPQSPEFSFDIHDPAPELDIFSQCELPKPTEVVDEERFRDMVLSTFRRRYDSSDDEVYSCPCGECHADTGPKVRDSLNTSKSWKFSDGSIFEPIDEMWKEGDYRNAFTALSVLSRM